METIAAPPVTPVRVTRPEDEPTTAERRELVVRELREAILRKVGVSARFAAESR